MGLLILTQTDECFSSNRHTHSSFLLASRYKHFITIYLPATYFSAGRDAPGEHHSIRSRVSDGSVDALVGCLQLLKGVVATLPFIGVRVLYGLLGGFAPSPLTIVDGKQVPSVPSNDGLGKFTTSSSKPGHLPRHVRADGVHHRAHLRRRGRPHAAKQGGAGLWEDGHLERVVYVILQVKMVAAGACIVFPGG
ncbi:hypothetical protein K466DRAFT_169562 [Polyporus arcularius HHB13444]|uniref:Uncharacterized protein n=1 Tax=Polyporus arcularius HHB13444 TaxID=1314778 RepID=A0A5C3PYW3_9APHY|nr:hypothetical protein K466DRAFT_169562 [Polyporus arcularius HHB13444]